MAEFDYELEYKPGKVNMMADALSWKVELAAISKLEGNLLGLFHKGMKHNPAAIQLAAQAHKGRT